MNEIDLRIRLYDIYIKIDAFPASVESDIKENRSEERKSISICIFNTISNSSESTNLKVQPIEAECVARALLKFASSPLFICWPSRNAIANSAHTQL